MHIHRSKQAERFEPPGHFGHLEVADVVARATGGNFGAQLSFCPPGGGGETHSHSDDAQLFLVVQGELTFDTGAERFTLRQQEGVLFEPGEPHATLNETSTPSLSVVVTVARPT